MKKLLLYTLMFVVATPLLLTSCNDDDDTISIEDYREWINDNADWLNQMESLRDDDGELVYTRIIPDYDKGTYILMKWFNDRNATKDNLTPYWTSTVDVKYYGQFYNNEPFDSSYTSVSPADSIFRTKLSTVIEGWGIALQQMHVGDTCEVIVPYPIAYGLGGSGSIPPGSNLKFGIKLVDIPYYEIKN